MNARILSLCSGYLGLDMAVESVLDAHTVAVSDIDPGAAKTLAHRAPDVPNLGDVKTIRWEDWAGVEIMTAGYPCQPFSGAGKRGGVMLPDGHVTDPAIGLSRNEQLKALGNGVVPPQAATALRFMLARTSEVAA